MSLPAPARASARPPVAAKTALRADRSVAWDRVQRARGNLRKRVRKIGAAATEARRSLDMYNYQRWYRAEDGRYVSPDPIGRAGGEAGYSAYVNSNPLGASDPSGLSPFPPFCEVCGLDRPATPSQLMRVDAQGYESREAYCDTCTFFWDDLIPAYCNSVRQHNSAECARCKCNASVTQRDWTQVCRASCGLDFDYPSRLPIDLFGDAPSGMTAACGSRSRPRPTPMDVSNSATRQCVYCLVPFATARSCPWSGSERASVRLPI